VARTQHAARSPRTRADAPTVAAACCTATSQSTKRIAYTTEPTQPSTPGRRLFRSPVMAHLFFAASIQRHIETPERDVDARSLHDALEAVFSEQPRLRGYIVDDQGALRKHLAVFIDGRPIRDRQYLSDALERTSRVYVVQALSGG
jgi:sulfur carrier protein ThiS